nr:MAG TPA: hypothetical protein [Caudoviricetes sp.]
MITWRLRHGDMDCIGSIKITLGFGRNLREI